jgi:hypothetical protein
MKKIICAPLLSLAFATLVLSSCDKDGDNTPAKTKTELMTNGAWKFESATAAGFPIPTTDPRIECLVDNTITFTNATTGVIAEGANICAPSTAGNFTWSFQNNESTIQFSAPLLPGTSPTFNIVSLTETKLVISQTVDFPPPMLVEITFKH